MNVKLTSTYDGYATGNVIYTSLHEGRLLIARGLAVQHTVADLATGFKQGSCKRSTAPVVLS